MFKYLTTYTGKGYRSIVCRVAPRGGRYLGYIVKSRYSDVTIPVSSKILGNDIIVIILS